MAEIFKLNAPITTLRMRLDSFNESDYVDLKRAAESLNEQADNHETKPWVAFYVSPEAVQREVLVEEKVRDYLDWQISHSVPGDNSAIYGYAIKRLDDGAFLGSIGIVFFHDEKNEELVHRDLGYFIIPEFQENGYGFEAAKAVCQNFFEQYPLLEATAHPDNQASIKLLRKLGAKVVRRIRHTKYGNEPRLVFNLTKEDFERSGMA